MCKPEKYERISSDNHKNRIVESFSSLIADGNNEATTDDKGGKHSISPTNRAALEEMARKGGYKVIYPEVGPHGRPYTYSHGIFGEWDSDIEKNNDIRFQEVARPNKIY